MLAAAAGDHRTGRQLPTDPIKSYKASGCRHNKTATEEPVNESNGWPTSSLLLSKDNEEIAEAAYAKL